MIAAGYKKKTRIEGTIFVSRPVAGATVIKREFLEDKTRLCCLLWNRASRNRHI
jgi:hypothetical protein